MRRRFIILNLWISIIWPISAFADSRKISVSEVPWAPGSVLWRDPGPVESLDFATGIGGESLRPVPPYTFVEELKSGVNPKIRVRDGRGRDWVLKWGREAKAENISARLAWAAGYFVLPIYFVPEGRIDGMGSARNKFVTGDGQFRDARFQLWGLLKGHNWTWDYNPFVGTRELNGLKIVMMLTSNWDNKDARQIGRLSANTAIVEHVGDGGTEYRYIIQDWGATLGKWGLPLCGRNKWKCEDYLKQSTKFVRGIDHTGALEADFAATWHDISSGIPIQDVVWIMEYLGRITDAQLRAGLEASGATPEESACFASAIRGRIERLRDIASGASESVSTKIVYPRIQKVRDPRK